MALDAQIDGSWWNATAPNADQALRAPGVGKAGLQERGCLYVASLRLYVPGRTRCSVPPAALAVRQQPEMLSTPHLYRLVKGADTPDARR